MATSANLNLYLPARTDYISVERDLTQNYEKIDAAYGTQSGSLSATGSAIAIVSTGNTHIAISAGQYVYVKSHSTLTEGLYIANSNIAANATLTSSNLTSVSNGMSNHIKSIVDRYTLSDGTLQEVSTDLDSVLDSGFYYCLYQCTNQPLSGEPGYLHVEKRSNDYCSQTWHKYDDTDVYSRVKSNGTWSSWVSTNQTINTVNLSLEDAFSSAQNGKKSCYSFSAAPYDWADSMSEYTGLPTAEIYKYTSTMGYISIIGVASNGTPKVCMAYFYNGTFYWGEPH